MGSDGADMGQEDSDGLGLYPFDFRPVSPFREGQGGVNEQATPPTAGRNSLCWEQQHPSFGPWGSDRERQDAPSQMPWVGADVGNPIRGGVATGVCGRERQFKPHSNTDMDPLRGRTALRQQGSPEGRDRPGLSGAQEPGRLQCQGARSKGGFSPTCGVEGGRRAATRRVKVN